MSRGGRSAGGGRKVGAETIHIDDPDMLRRLAGPNDAHLALIEDALEVDLAAPGGAVTVHGEPAARDQAKRVIEALCDRLSKDELVGESEVRAALMYDAVPGGAPAGADDVIHVSPRKSFKGRTPMQGEYVRALNDPKAELIFGVGPAGTGKTFLAVAQGAAALARRMVERLIIARPAVEAGEQLGFLPGDLYEKVDPYMLPIWDALRETLGQETVEKRRAEGRIEVAPLAFMRGRTLSNAFVIVDEAQNATVSQMLMVLTRLGEGSRMVVTGDPSQVDLKAGETSGLAHALGVLDGVEGVRAIHFTRKDVVRHALVGRIVEAYEKDASPQMTQKSRSDKDRGRKR
ncbi:MAG: PhoH family protein [Maricaulaceae bacterium]